MCACAASGVAPRIARAVILRHAFTPPDRERLANLCGVLDENLRAVERAFEVAITRRQEAFRVEGRREDAQAALGLLQSLYEEATGPIGPQAVQLALRRPPAGAAGEGATVLHTRRTDLAPRSANQARYLRQMLTRDLSFGIGPAGTGKTFLAVACAVDALERSAVQRIVLTRPAVEAGEKLGFLPGDLTQKVDPYLRPLYDALYEMLGFDKVARLIERNVIEIAPLAYMRGRTLNDSFVILDEAQNSTVEQMKMFLTRIGFGTTTVVTGDVTQVDLPRNTRSGLRNVIEVLRDVEGISFTFFTARDVVRHPLVAKIVRAYEAAEERNGDAAP